MTGVHAPSSQIDPFSMAFFDDPYPQHEALREAGPVVRLERYGIWAMARYAQVQSTLSDWQTFISGAGAGIHDLRKRNAWRPPSILLEADPPLHDNTRGVLTRILSAPAIKKLRADFEAEAERLVESLVARGTFDAVADLAIPYPLKVVGDAVGVPNERREVLLPYSDMLFNALGPENDIFKESIAQAGKVVPEIVRQCAREQLKPGSFGAQIYEAVDAGKLAPEHAPLMVRSLLSAGFDTTVNGISSAIFGFATHPEQWQLLRANPELRRTAFDEVMRWETPGQAFFRTTSRAVEVEGVTIPADKKILLMLGSANRDPRRWDNPDKLDFKRNSFGHVALGHGIHLCVGQMIARLEGELLISAFAERVASFELTGPAVRRPNNCLRGFASVPVKVTRVN
jgi:4-methoxybenzoate monooxygenase (O-demethylating)